MICIWHTWVYKDFYVLLIFLRSGLLLMCCLCCSLGQRDTSRKTMTIIMITMMILIIITTIITDCSEATAYRMTSDLNKTSLQLLNFLIHCKLHAFKWLITSTSFCFTERNHYIRALSWNKYCLSLVSF